VIVLGAPFWPMIAVPLFVMMIVVASAIISVRLLRKG
jgi:hypothetical protein